MKLLYYVGARLLLLALVVAGMLLAYRMGLSVALSWYYDGYEKGFDAGYFANYGETPDHAGKMDL